MAVYCEDYTGALSVLTRRTFPAGVEVWHGFTRHTYTGAIIPFSVREDVGCGGKVDRERAMELDPDLVRSVTRGAPPAT